VDEGGGAFYGPKIDIKIRDAIGGEGGVLPAGARGGAGMPVSAV